MKNYLLLEKEMRFISHITNVINILYWDIATYCPRKSVGSREEEITTLTLLVNNKLKTKQLADLVQIAKEEREYLDEWQLANIKEIERNIKETSYLDDKLQKEIITSTTQCELIWREARKNNDYNTLKPYLQRVLDATCKIANIKAKELGCSAYDALVDIYDPERKTTELKKIYDVLKMELPPLIQQIIEKQTTNNIRPLDFEVNENKQQQICKRIAEVIGFDFSQGRLDISEHPACWGSSRDVRLTNRYHNLISAIMGIIHEAGHGLYEQNLPDRYKEQPVGKAKGMAIHESQSLFMEMQVGRSKEFIEYLSKLLRDEFDVKSSEHSSENLYNVVTHVQPGLIRVDADEVTYLMHNLLRFEIEIALIDKEVTLDELPEIWNKKMKEYLNIVPTSDRDGCMQDIQWITGSFGYFPAYANGITIASMLMKQAKILHSNIFQDISKGNFVSINTFLNENIRKYGSLKSTKDLVKDSTGEDRINPMTYINYIKEKYLLSI